MNRFWIILRDKEDGTYVTKRHATEADAKTEAERLCRKEKARFFVLEVTACVEPQEPPVVWLDAK